MEQPESWVGGVESDDSVSSVWDGYGVFGDGAMQFPVDQSHVIQQAHVFHRSTVTQLLHGNNPEVVSMHMHGVVVIHVFALVHKHHLHYLP